MWLRCTERNLTIHAEHIPGILNERADTKSRNLHHSSDWRLDPIVFKKLIRRWGSCTIDLFAARAPPTTLSCRGFSFRPDLHGGIQCTSPRLEGREAVCFSSIHLDWQIPAKIETGQCQGSHPDSSCMAIPGLVSTAAGLSDRFSTNTPVKQTTFDKQPKFFPESRKF